MKKIGITTTVPLEVLLASGREVIDLNNIFVTSDDYEKYIDYAEQDGFPKSMCAWVKGLYGVTMYYPQTADNRDSFQDDKQGIDEVVGVIGGDCSNTKSLTEVLKHKGKVIHDFSYPTTRTLQSITEEINRFMEHFHVTVEEVEEVRKKLNKPRALCKEIDRLTYETNQATGFENHLYQLCASDFNTNYIQYTEELENKIKEIQSRKPLPHKLRLAYVGVPPMTSDLFEFVEQFHGRIVYNEVQREFAFPRADQAGSIYEQYYDYTYPYDIEFRIKHIKEQIELRGIHGIIHYTQGFCHRAIDDIVIKSEIKIPIINIEGDKLTHLDARTKLRLEAFLDMLMDICT